MEDRRSEAEQSMSLGGFSQIARRGPTPRAQVMVRHAACGMRHCLPKRRKHEHTRYRTVTTSVYQSGILLCSLDVC